VLLKLSTANSIRKHTSSGGRRSDRRTSLPNTPPCSGAAKCNTSLVHYIRQGTAVTCHKTHSCRPVTNLLVFINPLRWGGPLRKTLILEHNSWNFLRQTRNLLYMICTRKLHFGSKMNMFIFEIGCFHNIQLPFV
jgi:hypothetical protein